MDMTSTLIYLGAGLVWLLIGLNCAEMCQKLDAKATGKASTSSFIVGLLCGFLGIVYYIAKVIVSEKKEEI